MADRWLGLLMGAMAGVPAVLDDDGNLDHASRRDLALRIIPVIRDEVADELDLANTETCAVLRRIWTDPKDREVVDAVEVLLEQRADEVRRG